jgi:hypothetical protein
MIIWIAMAVIAALVANASGRFPIFKYWKLGCRGSASTAGRHSPRLLSSH